MKEAIQAVRGMNDILPGVVEAWQHVESAIRRVMSEYGYREIRIPTLERTTLFARSIGEQTDIVEKEMYTFEDRNGDSLTLRPEGTVGCVRAGIQHGLFHNRQLRMWYAGPMFRYERPQKGRYREFHQFGAEVFGWPGPDVDVELILTVNRLLRLLNVTGVELEINSLGSPEARAKYREQLVRYLELRRSELDADSLRRLERNPLRILDSKNPGMKSVIEQAPILMDHLDDESLTHFHGLCGYLDRLGVPYRINHRLVRGLDYYTRTVFEWVSGSLGAQSAVCAGGRYDLLVEQLGGRPTPAAGYALGLERLVALIWEAQTGAFRVGADAYFATAGAAAETKAMSLAESLRDQGFWIQGHCGGGSLKSQMRRADQSGACVAILLGQRELERGKVILKPLRSDAPQELVAFGQIAEVLDSKLPSNSNQLKRAKHPNQNLV